MNTTLNYRQKVYKDKQNTALCLKDSGGDKQKIKCNYPIVDKDKQKIKCNYRIVDKYYDKYVLRSIEDGP